MAVIIMPAEESKLIVLKEWSGKFLIVQDMYESVAKELVKNYKEIRHVLPKSILFIENTEGKAKDKGRPKFAQINKLPQKWGDIIKQISGRNFDYIIEIQKENISNFTWEQVVMMIYRELRKIDLYGNIQGYDIEEFSEIAYNLGTDWKDTNRLIPNLIEAKGCWERMKQPRLFEPEEFKEKSLQ